MTVMVIAPHADDEVLGCGGVIRKYVDDGERVVVLVMSNAALGAPELFSSELIQEIRREAVASHKVLGVADSVFLEHPAPRLDQVPAYQLAESIVAQIRIYSPHTVFLPHRGDVHVDHGAVFGAGLVAVRPHPGQVVRDVYCYEVLSETEWAPPTPEAAFLPVRYVDISRQLEAKLRAMECFKSQLREFPHPRSLRAIEIHAQMRGTQCGREAAEAFWVVRQMID